MSILKIGALSNSSSSNIAFESKSKDKKEKHTGRNIVLTFGLSAAALAVYYGVTKGKGTSEKVNQLFAGKLDDVVANLKKLEKQEGADYELVINRVGGKSIKEFNKDKALIGQAYYRADGTLDYHAEYANNIKTKVTYYDEKGTNATIIKEYDKSGKKVLKKTEL